MVGRQVFESNALRGRERRVAATAGTASRERSGMIHPRGVSSDHSALVIGRNGTESANVVGDLVEEGVVGRWPRRGAPMAELSGMSRHLVSRFRMQSFNEVQRCDVGGSGRCRSSCSPLGASDSLRVGCGRGGGGGSGALAIGSSAACKAQGRPRMGCGGDCSSCRGVRGGDSSAACSLSGCFFGGVRSVAAPLAWSKVWLG